MYGKKMWTAEGCLADHREVFMNLPRILGAYIGPNAIEPDLNESVMVTVNSENSCPFCEGLHGELARMAGVDEVDALMNAESLEECQKFSTQSAIGYARIFAESNGRGAEEEKAYADLVAAEGTGRADSVRALCWFLLWGSLGGNTINGLLARLQRNGRSDSGVIFEVIFGLFYGPLFLLIAVVNFLLQFFPTVPGWFSSAFGVVLTMIASVWIIPVGLLSLLVPGHPNVLAACVSE